MKTKLARRLVWAAVLIIIGWVGLAALGGGYFGKLSEVSSNDLTTFLPSTAESTLVNNKLPDFLQGTASTPAIVVIEAKDKLTEADNAKIHKAKISIGETDFVHSNVSPTVVSEDKKSAYFVVSIDKGSDMQAAMSKIRDTIANTKPDFTFKLTGPASFAEDLDRAFASIDGILLAVTLSVVFVILLLIYRSPILPIVTLLGAVLALAAAISVVYLLAKEGIVQMNGQVQGILFILVIGAATDYALLYVARYREELSTKDDKWQATKATWLASWEPIVAAGGTVTIGLLCLLVSDLGSNRSLGPVGGLGVIFSILSALTFLPSALLLFGKYAFWPKMPIKETRAEVEKYKKHHPFWTKIADFVAKHPRKLWLGLTAVLLIACIFVPQLKADGVAQSELVIGESEAREGQTLLDSHFPSGAGSPVMILTKPENKDEVVKLLDSHDRVDSVSFVAGRSMTTVYVPIGAADEALRATLTKEISKSYKGMDQKIRDSITKSMAGAPQELIDEKIATTLKDKPTIEELVEESHPFAGVKPTVVDGQIMLQATLKDPASSIEARNTVAELRRDIQPKFPNTKFGGLSAIQLDTNQTSERDLMIIIPLILAAITIILMLLLRSVVAPLLLLLTTIISFGATLGIAALLFNNVWQFPGGDPAVIIFSFVFLVALGIDYNIFLMSRVREETRLSGVKKGTIKALIVTGGVITSAGIVLASTFAALSVIPILFLVQIAFIVAFGVLLDTIVVRSLIVPGLTLDIGKKMWWPSRLSKNLK